MGRFIYRIFHWKHHQENTFRHCIVYTSKGIFFRTRSSPEVGGLGWDGCSKGWCVDEIIHFGVGFRHEFGYCGQDLPLCACQLIEPTYGFVRVLK